MRGLDAAAIDWVMSRPFRFGTASASDAAEEAQEQDGQ